MTGDNSAVGMMRVWERPKDLSFALDRLVRTPEFHSVLDLERVTAAGDGNVDLTIGSALDIFGGTGVSYADAVAFNRRL